MFWACLTTELYENEPHSFHGIGGRANGRFDYRTIFQAGISGLLDLKEHSPDYSRFYQSWMLIVEAYSQRELTRSSDRLAALAGIAIKFGRLLLTKILPDYGADICGGNFSGPRTRRHLLVSVANCSRTRLLHDHKIGLLARKSYVRLYSLH